MFSHVTLGSRDIERSRAFFEPVMTALGIGQPFELPGTLVFGELAGTKLFIGQPFDGNAASAGNGTHVALLAPTAPRSMPSTPRRWRMAAATRARRACARTITRSITAPMSAIPTATSSRRCAIASPALDPPRAFP